MESKKQILRIMFDQAIEGDSPHLMVIQSGPAIVVSMNARELHHFFRLRLCRRAQWEIRDLAFAMLRAVLSAAPLLFRDAGPECLAGACPEGEYSCGESVAVRAEFAPFRQPAEPNRG